MSDVYTYRISDNLYVNLTNRCTNRCAFCVRDQSAEYEGYRLWLEKEPSAQEVIGQIGDPKRFREVVFCGYGEPTFRIGAIKEIAAYVRAQGGKTRLNTNGHGNAVNKRNICGDLKEVDVINISLNAPSKEEYEALCRPHIENAFEEALSFAKACKQEGLNVLFSVVDCIGQPAVDKCKKIADGAGVPLRVRAMIGSL